MNSHHLGKIGEKLAQNFLLANGYFLISFNFHSRFGEIDIIAENREQNEIVFIEVKTRTSTYFCEFSELIGQKKMKSIQNTLYVFLGKNPQYQSFNWRIDLIAVKFNKEGNFISIDHLKNI